MSSGTRALLAITAVLLAPGAAVAAGVPEVSSGARPGPDALYAPPPAEVPQLENAAPWRARPILVSGASAYRDGEFVHQDWLTDDKGAIGTKDPTDPLEVGDFLFSPKTGTYTYPTDRSFANNGADLVEVRVRPLDDATAFRVTFNSMGDPERLGFTLALGGRPDELHAWPFAAGVRSPAEVFVTVHGPTAQVIAAATAPKADRLVVRATGVETAVVDTARARLSCAPQLDVTTDGPLDLRLACPLVTPSCGRPVLRVEVPQVRGRRVVEVRVLRASGRLVKRARGRALRVVHVRRPTSRAFTLRVRARTGGRHGRTVTVVRRYRACG